MSFTHLQVRSGYSLMNSTITIEKLVKRAKELNFKAIALTDENVLYGAIPFFQACKSNGLKPIIGMLTTVVSLNQEKDQCILLAKNNDGYKNLMKLSTYIQMNKKDSIDKEALGSLTRDLLCILPVQNSALATLLYNYQQEAAESYVDAWKDMFYTGDFYLGIQDHGREEERKLHKLIKAFHKIKQIPVAALNDVRYLDEKDDVAYDCLQAMKRGERWSLKITNPAVKQHHLRTTEEMDQLFGSFWPEVIKETESIVKKCDVSFNFNNRIMPTYPVPGQMDSHIYLDKICWRNVNQRYSAITKEISDRLTYELKVIKSMKFSDYFLIVWDFISYAKKNNIIVGPGRGSAAGSLVAYVLGITDVDPIKYGLLFERFLNPERITMPDIDIDFSDNRRDEVIEYVREKYGKEHVAQIITFGTFAPRSILRELIKTIGINQPDAYFIMKHIPTNAQKRIVNYVEESNELKQYIKQSESLKLLFTIAEKLEGLPRHVSTHAAGVVISDKPLVEHAPLTTGSNETSLTQYSMNHLEAIGLLKIDFLGLRNLTLLEKIIRSVQFSRNKDISLQEIPLTDSKTFALLQEGNTNGVFQLESNGMKQVLKNLKPTEFEDIVAVNALFRPGPMEYIPVYTKRKNKSEQVAYPHQDLASILEKTYGVLIYQEQIMQIAHQIAGFTLGQADILRRAVSKKNEIVMQEQREAFVRGCLQNGYERKIAEQIFMWIVKFSNYGFNRSHAVAYSKISYQLAFLKAHYPANFFAELLSSVANQQDKIDLYIKEAKGLKLSIVSPSINKSYGKYTVEGESIRIGLLSVKGIGGQVVKEIIRARKEKPFKSLFDFCLRVSFKVINRQVLENLILAGAFDELYPNRASLLATIDPAMEQGELFREFKDQTAYFKDQINLDATYIKMDDFSQIRRLTFEKELLGVYVSSHPLKDYRTKLRKNGYITMSNAKKLTGKNNLKCAVIVQSIKTIRTKRGDPMAFITIGDETADMQAVVFPELYRNKGKWLKEEMMIFVSGKTEIRNNSVQWLLSEIAPFDTSVLNQETSHRLFIKLTQKHSEEALYWLRKIACKFPGSTPIIVYHEESRRTYKLTGNYFINPNNECIQVLKNYFGKRSVVLER
ncbi:DNA polymerase III subunit alpha [Virgibacillus alimentarius]|uniref:DNA polymerase III subunit alpha n=1 Tax=Virgibacillus alimentarius TaxID=698769 RepID=A0ABS4SAM5_9BACI|nr:MULTISPECIES: DNA polymerase III subunit alpha [Virgibacillus]MBP2258558.1 DNA polymerase-3 subunit alpha [Virgibacillus alimentarius]HLR68449.1 DNA polymerase III subunit alpha [Virgibacillus sp.]